MAENLAKLKELLEEGRGVLQDGSQVTLKDFHTSLTLVEVRKSRKLVTGKGSGF